ncbi:MAG: hypothetical protein HYT94_02465 [Parcubacteria group bacterium]|nr:hypothetical protein [Parcubacteria group bacterium]
MEKRIKLLHSAICAAAVTAVFVAGITLFAEFLPALKDWLKAAFTHHWLGKSALSAVVFVLAMFFGYFFPLKTDAETIRKRILLLVAVSAASALVIILFFGYEAFFAHS